MLSITSSVFAMRGYDSNVNRHFSIVFSSSSMKLKVNEFNVTFSSSTRFDIGWDNVDWPTNLSLAFSQSQLKFVERVIDSEVTNIVPWLRNNFGNSSEFSVSVADVIDVEHDMKTARHFSPFCSVMFMIFWSVVSGSEDSISRLWSRKFQFLILIILGHLLKLTRSCDVFFETICDVAILQQDMNICLCSKYKRKSCLGW